MVDGGAGYFQIMPRHGLCRRLFGIGAAPWTVDCRQPRILHELNQPRALRRQFPLAMPVRALRQLNFGVCHYDFAE